MKVLKLNRENEDFYVYMGPVFGSRLVDMDTRDRFYDDADKQWYVVPGKGAASVREGSIRNFWAVSDEIADAMIAAILEDNPRRLEGVAPMQYEECFKNAGFHVEGYRKNFIRVYRYEKRH